MRFALALGVPVAAALLQASVVPFLAVGAARPNLVVLVAASWSIAATPAEAVWWAFWGGLAVDLLSGGPLGASALAALLPVAVVGVGETAQLRPRSAVFGAILVGVATLGTGVLYLMILVIAGMSLGDVASLTAAAVGGAKQPVARDWTERVQRPFIHAGHLFVAHDAAGLE